MNGGDEQVRHGGGTRLRAAVPPPPQEVYVMDSNAEQRIARLESQVEGLRKAVRELADALQEELTAYDTRIAALDEKSEEIIRIQTNQTRAIRKQEDRLRRSLSIIADAMSSLSVNETQTGL